MATSYNKLWKLLIDKKISKVELRKATGISPNTMTKLFRDEQMSAVAFILIVERGPVESSLKDCIAEDAIMKALDQMGSKIETDDTKRD